MNTVADEIGADTGADAPGTDDCGADDTGGASSDSCDFHSMPAQVGPPCSGGNGVRVAHSTGNGSRGPRGVETGTLDGGGETAPEVAGSRSAPGRGKLGCGPDGFIDCSG